MQMQEIPPVTESSLTDWYEGLRSGRSQATEKLWRLYFERMVRLARCKLAGTNRAMHDEEDVALSAFKSFCLGFQHGKFHAHGEQVNLWPLLVTLTINKSIDHLRSQNRVKRGGSGQEGVPSRQLNSEHVLELVISAEPSPESQVAVEESFEQLLASLDLTGDASLREIALNSIEGMGASEIAEKLGDCSVRTVQRKLKTIRAIWERSNP